MLKNYSTCALMLVASAGYTLAILGAVTTLWPHVPTSDGRADFAFSLAITFGAFLGNSILLGTERMISNQHSKSKKITSFLSIVIFYLSLMLGSTLFSEGLNAWFETTPTMSPSLILMLRLMILGPLIWLLVIVAMRLFQRNL